MYHYYSYKFIKEQGGFDNKTYKIRNATFVVSQQDEGKLRMNMIEKLSASSNSYMPTRAD